MVDTILTPETTCETPQVASVDQNYFLVDNYFAELGTEAGIARENLGVYSKSEVYTQTETDNNISKAVNDSMKAHLAADDPHQLLPKINTLLVDYVRKDGTVPFTAPQVGVDPLLDSHLTTKKYVTGLINTHLQKTDPHDVMSLVKEELKQYALSKNVYSKSNVYTKIEIDKLVKSFVKTDGTTPFTAPQSGVTPIADQHLATKRYVDNALFKHTVEADPHGFLTLLNQRLGYYYKTTETYSKAETYSRAQLHQIINTLVTDAAKAAIKEHVNQFDPHEILTEVYNEHYVKRDGSVPFTEIQKGIEGIEDDDLATVGQLNRVNVELSSKIEASQPIWITSGPVQSTVGHVEDETSLPTTMTLQDIMDAIFYGKTVDIETPELVAVGTTIPITMHIRGNAMINSAELYQNEELIGTYTSDDFLDWEYAVQSKPVYKNTTFTLKVSFMNGSDLTAQSVTNVSYGIFVGIVDKMCMPRDLSYNTLLNLVEQNENNKLYTEDKTIVHKYSFNSPLDPKKLTLVIPSEYNQLNYMHTASQHFGVDAFTVEEVPFVISGIDGTVLFTVYMYKEPLMAFNSEVTFKLNNNE